MVPLKDCLRSSVGTVGVAKNLGVANLWHFTSRENFLTLGVEQNIAMAVKYSI